MTPGQEKLIVELLDETGIDARLTYCASTGKVLGTLTDEQIDDMFAAIPIDSDADDIQSELLERTLSSSRPSPAWIKRRFDRKADLDWGNQMLLRDPVGIGAYLFNRLYSADTYFIKPMNYELQTHWQMLRIRMYSRVAVVHRESPELFGKLITVLLEIDSKHGLNKLGIPVGLPASPEFDPYPESMAAILLLLEGWRDNLNAEHARKIAENAAYDRSFVNGNRDLKMAFMQQWLRENPPSERTQANTARELHRLKVGDMFDALEAELTKVSLDGSKPNTLQSEKRVSLGKGTKPMRPSLPTAANFRFRGFKAKES